MDREYKHPKYFLMKNMQYKIDKKEWNTLQKMLDTARFWETKPIIEMCNIYGSCMDIITETGDWILEGHSKNGYQIKVIWDPNFKNDKTDKYFSKQLYYAKVFEFILSLAPIRCNNWLHKLPKSVRYLYD